MKTLLSWFCRERQYQVSISDSNGELITFFYCKAKSKKDACDQAMVNLKEQHGEIIEVILKASKFNPNSLDLGASLRKMSEAEFEELNEGRVGRGLRPIDRDGKPIG